MYSEGGTSMDFPIGSLALDSGRALSQSAADAYGWVLVGFALAVTIVAFVGIAAGVFVTRRHFWCASAEREVEVSFGESGLFRRPVAVRSCSMFDPSTEVTCRRDCLDRDVRVKLPMTSFFERTTS
jgi:hypothetical protein